VALKVLRRNLEQLGVESGFVIHAESVTAFLRSAARPSPKWEPYEVVFLDPPYDAAAEYATTLGLLGRTPGILAPAALVIAEHRRKQSLEDRYGSLKRVRLLEQGDAALSFYEAAPAAPDGSPAGLQ